jgi:type I restriction enzyme, S subunit
VTKTLSRSRTKVAFGDVVRLSRERSNDPEADGFERFVGLEHIDPGDLRIRRWGDVADGVTFTNVFRPGQALFGKRRAYQRKVAVADFSGVCSSDIYVLEPCDGRLLPELLPFICQTDAFFEHAVGTSAGSLSPRTNWDSLANFEFALPSVQEQQRIATVLGAIESTSSALGNLDSSLSLLEASIADAFTQSTATRVTVGDIVAETAYGSSQKATDGDSGVPILGIPNVARGQLMLNEYNRVCLTAAEVERYRLSAGDLLMVRTNGNPEYVGRCVVVGTLPGEFVYASYLIRLRVQQERVLPAYLAAILNSPTARRSMRGSVRSSAGNYNINTQEIRSQVIPLPDIDAQRAFVGRVSDVRKGRQECLERVAVLRALKARLFREADL